MIFCQVGPVCPVCPVWPLHNVGDWRWFGMWVFLLLQTPQRQQRHALTSSPQPFFCCDLVYSVQPERPWSAVSLNAAFMDHHLCCWVSDSLKKKKIFAAVFTLNLLVDDTFWTWTNIYFQCRKKENTYYITYYLFILKPVLLVCCVQFNVLNLSVFFYFGH